MTTSKVAYFLLYFPRWTETFIAEEIRNLRARGWEVEIVSLLRPSLGPTQPESRELLGCTWYAPGLFTFDLWTAQAHFLRVAPRRYIGSLWELVKQPSSTSGVSGLMKRLMMFVRAVSAARHLEASGVQLLHAHFAWLAGGAAWVCARLLGIPYTVTVHAFDVFSRKNELLPLVCGDARRVISISEANRAAVSKVTGTPISVIHCGVDAARLGRLANMRPDGPGSGGLRILSVGSLIAKKGHRYLIEACGRLLAGGIDFSCTIIGDGPDRSALEEQVRSARLEDYVLLAGPKTHDEVIAACLVHDIFVLSASVAPDGDRDGIPVVLMEAGAVGLPVISTAISGIPELVHHGVTGLLVPPGDSAALAEAIRALAADSGLRARLGAKAREWVEAEFEIRTNVEKLEEVLEEVIVTWCPAQGRTDIQGATAGRPVDSDLGVFIHQEGTLGAAQDVSAE
jgi:glycosyltransferase involved in cell wall biosynthesis